MWEDRSFASPHAGHPENGFTIIEVMVALAMVALIIGFGLFVGVDAYRAYSFYSETNMLVAVLEKARTQSLVNINRARHGVRIEANKYTIFEEGNPALDEVVNSSPAVGIIAGTLPFDIIFEQLSGEVLVPPASFMIQDRNGPRSVTVSINQEGRINW